MINVILSKEFQMKLKKLAWVMIHRSNHTLEIDDLIQIGQEAAIRAFRDYDPSFNTTPCTFFITRARLAMLNACAAGTDTLRLEDASDGAQAAADNVGVYPMEVLANLQDLNIIFSELTSQEIHVLVSYFCEEKTFNEIGAEWNMSKQAAQKQQLAALQKVQRRMAHLSLKDVA